MNGLPEGIVGKALALSLCVVLLGLMYVVAIQPLLALYADGSQRLQERVALADRLDASAHDLARLRAAAARWREKSSSSDFMFPAASDAVAAATLQSTVQGLITQDGGVLSSAEILPPQTQDNFRRVAIRVSFTGDLPVLTSVLSGAERARPAIFVDNLEIRYTGQLSDHNTDPSLAITLDAYGFPAP